jgi:hypothetical protein
VKALMPGILLAGGANVWGLFANVNFTYRLGYTILPIFFNYLVNKCKIQPYFNVIHFYDWVAQDRTARCRAELDSFGLRKYMLANKEAFQPLADSKGVLNVYKALEELQSLN